MLGTHDRYDQGFDTMPAMPNFGDHVDYECFNQLLEMDESEEVRDFSKDLVFNFFEQAAETFDKIEKALNQGPKELHTLSSLGHFLKGSSATLGFNKIRNSCEVVQQYGHKKRVDGSDEPDETVCLKKIEEALRAAKTEKDVLETMMKKFFGVE